MNNTIGIILCKEGNEIVAKYIDDSNMLISTYKLLNKV